MQESICWPPNLKGYNNSARELVKFVQFVAKEEATLHEFH